MNAASITEERAKQLHDRATRGVALSPEEQAEVEAWYAAQDRDESTLLGQSASGPSAAALQAQVDDAVAHLRAATEQIQELAAQNDTLRREIASLQRQLGQTLVAPAP